MRLAGAVRLLEYAILAPVDQADVSVVPFLRRMGFVEVTRTRRGWVREL